LCMFVFPRSLLALLFSFSAPATPEIYTLSLHDALPISLARRHRDIGAAAHDDVGQRLFQGDVAVVAFGMRGRLGGDAEGAALLRSEEHTSELQSRENLVCRLLLEKKKKEKHDQQRGRQE